MQAREAALIIYNFKLVDKLEKCFVSCQEIVDGFMASMDHTHGKDKLAEIVVELLREATIEEGRHRPKM
jgi:hypothetical protein